MQRSHGARIRAAF